MTSPSFVVKSVSVIPLMGKVESAYYNLIVKATVRMCTVLSSAAFKNALFEYLKHSNGIEGELSEWKNKPWEEIYNHYLGARTIELDLATYYSFRRVYGYTKPSTDTIFLNRKYISKYSHLNGTHLMALGSNLSHEYGHKRGFDHDFKATARRPNSLCYLINEAYEKAYTQIYGADFASLEKALAVKVPWYKRWARRILA